MYRASHALLLKADGEFRLSANVLSDDIPSALRLRSVQVSVKVSLLNFAITFSGLEDQLLGVVVVEEMPEMQEKKNSLGLCCEHYVTTIG